MALTTYTSPTLGVGWASDTTGIKAVPGYYKDAEGVVHLKGNLVKTSSARDNVAFILPAGYRPNRGGFYLVASPAPNAYWGVLYIHMEGHVRFILQPGHEWISLDGVSFKTGDFVMKPLVAPWVNTAPGGYITFDYLRDSQGFVRMQGTVKAPGAAFGSVIARLPNPDCWPTKKTSFCVYTAASPDTFIPIQGLIDVLPNGDIVFQGGNPNHIALNGNFYTRSSGNPIPLPLHGTWTSYSNDWQTAGYVYDAQTGKVTLTGIVKNNVNDQIICTLPANARPSKTLSFPVHTGASEGSLHMDPGIVQIKPDGTVFVYSAKFGFLSLEGISFIAG